MENKEHWLTGHVYKCFVIEYENQEVTGKEIELKIVVSSCRRSAEAVEDGQQQTLRGETWQQRKDWNSNIP